MSLTGLRAFRYSAYRLGTLYGRGFGRPCQIAGYSRLHRTAPASKIVEALKEDGFVVIRSLFSHDQVHGLNSDFDGALSRTVPGKIASKVAGSSVPEDDALFGVNTKRLDKLMSHSKTWRQLVDDDTIHGVCKEALGAVADYWLSTAQMIEIGPGSADGPLHPDAGLWYMLLGLDDKIAPELVLNFLVATTRTTASNGATGVVKGSHKLAMLSVLADPDADIWKTPSDQIEQIELEAGDCLLVGGRIFHRGSANVTPDERRRVLSCMVTSCVLTPEEAHPFFIEKEAAEVLSERAKRFLGYSDMKPAMGAGFWRR